MKVLFLLVFAIHAAGCAGKIEAEATLADCVAAAGNLQIVRIDERNKRLFLSQNGYQGIETPKNLAEALDECLTTSGLGEYWASVFTETRFAGYKDDPAITDFHKDGSWANAYLLEVNASRNFYVVQPARGWTEIPY